MEMGIIAVLESGATRTKCHINREKYPKMIS